MTPIVPPVYIHHGPAGSGTTSDRFTKTPIERKITKKVVPIMKFRKDVAKL